MASAIILIFSQLSFIVGVFLATYGVSKGFKEKAPFNWKALINGSLIGGLFLIAVSLYWIYALTGRFQLG